jgi:hypothetical protein
VCVGGGVAEAAPKAQDALCLLLCWLPTFTTYSPHSHDVQFTLKIPFRSAGQIASAATGGGNSPIAGGGNYQLTYLDEDMLIGRATALGGVFIFSREGDSPFP